MGDVFSYGSGKVPSKLVKNKGLKMRHNRINGQILVDAVDLHNALASGGQTVEWYREWVVKILEEYDE